MTEPRLIALYSPAPCSGKTTIVEAMCSRHGFVRVTFARPLKQMAEGLLDAIGMPEDEARDIVWGDDAAKARLIPDFSAAVFDATVEGVAECMLAGLLDALNLPGGEVVSRIYGSQSVDVVPTIGLSVDTLKQRLVLFLDQICDGSEMTSRRLQQLIGTEFGRVMIRAEVWVDIAMDVVDRYRRDGKDVAIDDLRFPNEHAAVLSRRGKPWRVTRPDARRQHGHASEGALDHVKMDEFRNSSTLSDLHIAVDNWMSL